VQDDSDDINEGLSEQPNYSISGVIVAMSYLFLVIMSLGVSNEARSSRLAQWINLGGCTVNKN